MNNRPESGWVPDRLPDFNRKDLQFRITVDSQIGSVIKDIAQMHQLELSKVASRLLMLGALAVDATIILRTNLGRERIISLMDEDLDESKPDSKSNKGGTSITLRLPRKSGDEFMEAANRYNITVEELLERMLRLGIKISQTKDNPETNYMIRMDNKDRKINIGFTDLPKRKQHFATLLSIFHRRK